MLISAVKLYILMWGSMGIDSSLEAGIAVLTCCFVCLLQKHTKRKFPHNLTILVHTQTSRPSPPQTTSSVVLRRAFSLHRHLVWELLRIRALQREVDHQIYLPHSAGLTQQRVQNQILNKPARPASGATRVHECPHSIRMVTSELCWSSSATFCSVIPSA